jgi:ribose 5-phosphate isomerase B
MATNGSGKTPLRIVVGSDNAGHAYKTALKEELKKHAGVTHVLDVGVNEADDSTAYPHLAVDACKMIKSGEVSPAQTCGAFMYKVLTDHRPTEHF